MWEGINSAVHAAKCWDCTQLHDRDRKVYKSKRAAGSCSKRAAEEERSCKAQAFEFNVTPLNCSLTNISKTSSLWKVVRSQNMNC